MVNTPNREPDEVNVHLEVRCEGAAAPATIRPSFGRISRLPPPLLLFSLMALIMPTRTVTCHRDSPCLYPELHPRVPRGAALGA